MPALRSIATAIGPSILNDHNLESRENEERLEDKKNFNQLACINPFLARDNSLLHFLLTKFFLQDKTFLSTAPRTAIACMSEADQ